MTKKLLIALLVIVAFIVESRVSVFGVRPSVTVLIAYFAGLRYGALKGMSWGAALGALSDGLSGGMLGPALLGKASVGYLSSLTRTGLFTWTPLLGFLAVIAFTVIDGLVQLVSAAVFSQSHTELSGILPVLLIQGLLNSAAGPFLRPRDED